MLNTSINLKTKNLIFFCLGYTDTENNPHIIEFKNELQKYGHEILIIKPIDPNQPENIEKQVQSILKTIEEQPQETKIFLLGHSLGALNAMIASLKSERLSGLITLNGFFGLPLLEWKMLKTYLGLFMAATFSQYHFNLLKFIIKNFHPAKIKIPCLIIHSQDDQTSSIWQSRLFFKFLKSPKKFAKTHKIDHGLTQKEFSIQIADIINSWLKNF